MDKVAELLNSLGGVAYTHQLRRAGARVTDLQTAVGSGSVRRLRRGVYALPGLRVSTRTAALHGGAVTCLTLLRVAGVWVLDDLDHSLHVWMGVSGRQHQHPDCTCKAHFGLGRTALGLVSVPTALVHLYTCQGEESFICSYESAWNQGILSAADREWIRQQLPRDAHWLLDFAVATSESGLETLVRFRLRVFGFRVVTQFRAHGDRTDLLIESLVLLETDGNDNHSGPSKRHKDLAKDARSSIRGYETLRFDYRQVVHDWLVVQKSILAALKRAKGRV